MKQELIKVEEKRNAFDLNQLLPIGMMIVTLAIGIAIGLQILGETRDEDTDLGVTASCGTNSTGGGAGTILYSGCGEDYNASQQGIIAVAKIPSKLGLVVTVILAAVVIGILFRYMSFGKK